MKLTPLKLDKLLQLYWNPKFHPGCSPADESAMEEFAANGLIMNYSNGSYKLTERGKVFVHMILATPLPQELKGWADPRTGELIK